MRLLQRLRSQRVVVEAVEVTAEGEVVLRPDSFERADELLGATIALVVVEPWLADGPELTAEPAADDVDSGAAAGSWSSVASCFAATAGFQGPGSRATISLSRSVAASNA